MKRQAIITGRGAFSAVGRGVEALWQASVNGRSGVRAETRDDFTGLSASPVSAAFRAEDLAALGDDYAGVEASLADLVMRDVIEQALREAGIDGPVPGRVALVTFSPYSGEGTTPAEFLDYVAAVRELATGGDVGRAAELAFFAERGAHPTAPLRTRLYADLAARLGTGFEVLSLEATCATALRLIIEARRLIELDRADCVIIGSEVMRITQPFFGSYAQMLALSRWPGPPALASRPFDKRRSGMVLADGAGALVLETESHARARGATTDFGRVHGWGLCTGLAHPTAPAVEPMRFVMQRALEHSGVAAQQVDAINVHGTSTKLNDLCEARAIRELFGERTATLGITACKSILGHPALAAAILEVVVATCSMAHGLLPPVPSCEERDPKCDIPVRTEAVRRPLEVVLKNAFGFGGHYATVVLSRR